jgi:arginine exporter protein ArgO
MTPNGLPAATAPVAAVLVAAGLAGLAAALGAGPWLVALAALAGLAVPAGWRVRAAAAASEAEEGQPRRPGLRRRLRCRRPRWRAPSSTRCRPRS